MSGLGAAGLACPFLQFIVLIMAVSIEPSGRLSPSIRQSVRRRSPSLLLSFPSPVPTDAAAAACSSSAWFAPVRPCVLAALPDFFAMPWPPPYRARRLGCSKRGTVAGLSNGKRCIGIASGRGTALVQIKAEGKLCTILHEFTVCTPGVLNKMLKVTTGVWTYVPSTTNFIA